jgi:hypothetical protein
MLIFRRQFFASFSSLSFRLLIMSPLILLFTDAIDDISPLLTLLMFSSFQNSFTDFCGAAARLFLIAAHTQ